MMEKVKLTEEQARVIENCVSKEQLIVAKATGLLEQGRDEGIEKLSMDDLVKALYIGYEVKEKCKVGDWVITETKGRIAIVTKIVCGYQVYGHWNDEVEEKWNPLDSIRQATPEEIKTEQERRLWAEIDREPLELRWDDVLVLSNGEVINVTSYKSESYVRQYLNRNLVKRLYPAESFISFKEESK